MFASASRQMTQRSIYHRDKINISVCVNKSIHTLYDAKVIGIGIRLQCEVASSDCCCCCCCYLSSSLLLLLKSVCVAYVCAGYTVLSRMCLGGTEAWCVMYES